MCNMPWARAESGAMPVAVIAPLPEWSDSARKEAAAERLIPFEDRGYFLIDSLNECGVWQAPPEQVSFKKRISDALSSLSPYLESSLMGGLLVVLGGFLCKSAENAAEQQRVLLSSIGLVAMGTGYGLLLPLFMVALPVFWFARQIAFECKRTITTLPTVREQ